MRRSEAITQFLAKSTCPIAKWYNNSMEVQVQVAQDSGDRYQGNTSGIMWRGFTNETGEIWKNFRMPLGTKSDSPKDNDGVMTFDLASHVEGIGMTGWDWRCKLTRWVGFDFDSIVNHKMGLAQADLDDLINKCLTVKGLSILRSTSGKGYHIYLKFDQPIPTENHGEHAAVARSLLSVLSVATGFDFRAKVDCVGSILWVWHRKSEGTNGLQWVKDAGDFPAKLVPENWRDHLRVVRGRENRVELKGGIGSLVSAMKDIELEQQHRDVLKWMQDNSTNAFYWDSDHKLLVCHTIDLQKCHETMKLRGLFHTESSGTSEVNAFCFPIQGGAWVVRRYGKNVQEHQSWVTDESGWTKTYFNAKPSIERACRFFGGLENKKGAYIFDSLSATARALEYLDLDLNITPEMERAIGERQISVEYSQKKSKVYISFNKQSEDKSYYGWLSAKTTWEKVLRYTEDASEASALNIDIDEWVRHTVSADSSSGWYICSNGTWVSQSDGAISKVLCTLIPEADANELRQIEGKAILNPWVFSNNPFEVEYPGGRLWNKQGAKFAVAPAAGLTPTWDELFDHVGKALNEAIVKNAWCREQGIYTGGDYLRYWSASVCQRPEQQLPYLFLCGEQKTGKSTFHQALELLFEDGRGYMFADAALKSPSGFNGELVGAVVCVIEEVDLSHSRSAANRLKDWVTADYFAARALYKDIQRVRSYMHFIQCANNPKNVPVFDGDTRVVMIPVYTLEKETPKKVFLQQLKDEAPAMLHKFLGMDLGKPESRLGMPVLDTALKQSVMQSNFTLIERFIDEECVAVQGKSTNFLQFGSLFRNWLQDNNYMKYMEQFEQHKLRPQFPERGNVIVGEGLSGELEIANLVCKSMCTSAQLVEMCNAELPALRMNAEGIIC